MCKVINLGDHRVLTIYHFRAKELMNAQALAEIASWVAVHSGALVFGNQPQPSLAAKTYWTASRCRLQRWSTALKMFENDIANDVPGHDPWPAVEIIVQEILISEVLTRVWSAAMVTHDSYQDSDELHGLAHGIHIGHIEAKNRAIRIILKGQANHESSFDKLNQLRRHLERWTDLFLSQMPVCESAESFAFDQKRVSDFRAENRMLKSSEMVSKQQLLCASFASDVATMSNPFPANPELNRKIASGLIACFPMDRFDSTGLPKSTRQIWIEKTQVDVQMLMDHLIDFEDNSDQLSMRDMPDRA